MITLKELERISASRGAMPADEWAALLESCPEWVAQRDAREAELVAKEARYLVDEAPLRTDLSEAGFNVKWVWDFVNADQAYESAIPILLDHLRRPYGDDVREGIARALSIREARGLAGGTILEVLGEPGLGGQLRWALANALAIVADGSNRAGIKALAATEANKDVAARLTKALKTATIP